MKIKASQAARIARKVGDEFAAYADHCTGAEWDPSLEDDWQNLIDFITDIIAEDHDESKNTSS